MANPRGTSEIKHLLYIAYFQKTLNAYLRLVFIIVEVITIIMMLFYSYMKTDIKHPWKGCLGLIFLVTN